MSLNDTLNDDRLADLSKQMYLPNEFRFQQQDEKLKLRAAPNTKVTLGMLLNRTFDVREEEISDLYVVSDNTSKKEGKLITDRDEIWNFDLCEAILIKRDDGSVGYKSGENVT